MNEEKESKLEEKIDNLTKVVYEIKGSIDANTHGDDIAALKSDISDLKKKQSNDTGNLYSLLRDHEKEYHSSNNSRANWTAIIAAICALATVASAIIMHMKG